MTGGWGWIFALGAMLVPALTTNTAPLEHRIIWVLVFLPAFLLSGLIALADIGTFQSVACDPDPGIPASSFRRPLQTFADSKPSPGKIYVYRMVAMAGQPGGLVEDADLSLSVATERVDQRRHAIFFNRGAVTSQAYAQRW